MAVTNLTVTFGSEAAVREFVHKASGTETAMLVDGRRVYVITTDANIRNIYDAAKPHGGLVISRDTCTPDEETFLVRVDEDE